jgi:hypothetical protein
MSNPTHTEQPFSDPANVYDYLLERLCRVEAELRAKDEQLRVAREDSERLDWLDRYYKAGMVDLWVDSSSGVHLPDLSDKAIRDVIDATRNPTLGGE